MKNRAVRKIIRSKPVIEGAGVHLHRAFGNAEVPLYDPFLLLDDFRSDDPQKFLKGFPWHPHRGIETVTYVLEGDVEHGDSMGNAGVIGSGDVQWMTAGSGIIHQEMPKGDGRGRMYGFQLWANLPASHKMMDPRYRGLRAADIPSVKVAGGVSIKVIAGTVQGVSGPVQDIVTDPEYLDVTVPPHTAFTHATIAGHTAFAYVIEGKGLFGGEGNAAEYELEDTGYGDIRQNTFVGNRTLVLFDKTEGVSRDKSTVSVLTEEEPVRFLLVSGKPIGEPVAWYGPIVMNTREELRLAFEEFDAGTFVKSPTTGRTRSD